MKTFPFISILIVGLFLSGCTSLSYYYPNKTYHPMSEKKGDVQAELSTFIANEFSGYSLQGGYAITDNHTLFGGFHYGNKNRIWEDVTVNISSTDTVLQNRQVDLEMVLRNFNMGYAWVKSIDQGVFYGAAGSISHNTTRYNASVVESSNLNGERNLNYLNFSAGPFIRFRTPVFSISVATNFGACTFTSVSNKDRIVRGTGKEYETDIHSVKTGSPYLIFHPSIQSSFGAENYRLFINYSFARPLSTMPFNYANSNVNMGFLVFLNTKGK